MSSRWNKKKLRDLLVIQNGYAFSSKSFSSTDGVPLIRIRDLKNGSETETNFVGDYDSKYEVNGGDLLIGMDGEFACYRWQGPTALLNQRVCRLQDFSHDLYPDFLLYGINRHLSEIEQRTTFTTVKHLSAKQVYSIELPLPPLPEQRRIVAILDEAFEGIDAAVASAERNLASARELFESHLNSVFARKGEGWVERRLKEVCEKITVGHVGPMVEQYRDEGIPFLRSQNIRPFQISLDNVVYIDTAFHGKLAKSELHPGDLAIIRTGFPGTTAVIPETIPVANCSDLVIARTGAAVSPHYVALFLNSAYGKRLVTGNLTGAAQKHFNVTAAKEVLIPLPSIAEQHNLVARLHELRENTQSLEYICRRKLAALAELRQSMLRKAFAGELTAEAAEKVAAA